MAIKILIFDYRESEKQFFKKNNFTNYDIKFYDFSLTEDTVNNIPQEDKDNASIISVFIDSYVTENIITQFKNLRLIATRSTGFDHINKKGCITRNISVINVQNYGEIAVAEYTMGIILSLTRRLYEAITSIKNGEYKNKSFIGKDLQSMTLGVVGTGAIGSAVCKLANAFNMKILAYDIQQRQELANKYNVIYTNLDFLIKNSDIISLHVPYTGNNYHMFSKKEFDMMKENSYFINISRGELVNLKYLAEQLNNGKILGVGLDVVACECSSLCENFNNRLELSSLDCFESSKIIRELLEKPNVLITPHIAYESQNAINYILQETFNGIHDFINGENKNRVI